MRDNAQLILNQVSNRMSRKLTWDIAIAYNEDSGEEYYIYVDEKKMQKLIDEGMKPEDAFLQCQVISDQKPVKRPDPKSGGHKDA